MESEQRGKYLLKNTAIFALGNMGTKFVGFFLVPIYTGVLSTYDYGIVDLIYTVVTVLMPIFTLNVSESVMRFTLDKDANHNQIMSLGLGIWVLSIFASLIVIPVADRISVISNYSVYLYFYIVSFGGSQIFLYFLRGKELLVQYSVGNIINSLCIAIFNILFLIIFKKGIAGYFLAFILANVFTMFYAFVSGSIVTVIKNFKLNRLLIKKMLLYSTVLIPNSLMWWLMNSSDRIMVTAMISADANGVYAISYKVPTLLATMTTVFTQAWSYSAIREAESKDKDEYSGYVYDKMVQIVLIIGVGLMTIMKPFMKLYVSDSYYEAWRYTPYLIIGFVFMTLATFLASSYTVHKDSKGYLKSGIIGAMVNIILNLILILAIGVAGAALATCFAYLAVFLYRIFDTRKYIKIKIVKKEYVLGFSILVFSALTMFSDRLYFVLQPLLFAIELLIFKDLIIAILNNVKKVIIRKING